MEKLTMKSLQQKLIEQEQMITRMNFVILAMCDRLHFGKEELIKFNKKLNKYGTQTKKN